MTDFEIFDQEVEQELEANGTLVTAEQVVGGCLMEQIAQEVFDRGGTPEEAAAAIERTIDE